MPVAQAQLNAPLHQRDAPKKLCGIHDFTVAHGVFIIFCSKCNDDLKNKNAVARTVGASISWHYTTTLKKQ